jgi:hypothetical protein
MWIATGSANGSLPNSLAVRTACAGVRAVQG